MALNFGQSLGVSGNIKLTDVELVTCGYRTLKNSADTGSIPIGRLEDGQVFYIENDNNNYMIETTNIPTRVGQVA